MELNFENNYIEDRRILEFVNEYAKLLKPEKIYFCDGSEDERKKLTEEAVKKGILIELNLKDKNGKKIENCYLHRSDVNDVARTESLTFINTKNKDDAGWTNNWKEQDEMLKELREISEGSMKGRTMYVVPFLMGIPGNPLNKIGILLTDSLYVVLSMGIMTRIGKIAIKEFELLSKNENFKFVKCIHCTGNLDINKRRICHFPELDLIWSTNTAYGGNALLNKKCLGLRLAGYYGRKEGWMAEHVGILEIITPKNEKFYIVFAFPSNCGKTNLSMLNPPEEYNGYKVRVIGDDIGWMYIKDGRLYVINPEAGMFCVAPGTNENTNPNLLKAIEKGNIIFTNVATNERKDIVWWEGMEEPNDELIDWRGNKWNKKDLAAHPNSRITISISQIPNVSDKLNDPEGVPVSAILFGGRRKTLAPLIYEAFNWQHGVFIGATMASERTAAAMDAEFEIRRDPMAMLPFCGYNMADYFRHWLEIGKKLKYKPKIFHVNWFRKENNRFLWPGFGENIRVLEWIIRRCKGEENIAVETPIGYIPTIDSINLKGIEDKVNSETLKKLLSINVDEYLKEVESIREFFNKFDKNRFPKELFEELENLKERLLKSKN
ncbi:MAG: phosphoenolpyruvate carboxykinase (GTP) [Candidatus Altarchaeaceae archaeon]